MLLTRGVSEQTKCFNRRIMKLVFGAGLISIIIHYLDIGISTLNR